MKQKLIKIFLLLSVFITFFIFYKSNSIAFFAWTDGYLASPVNEKSTIALTLFYKNSKPFRASEIINLEFENIKDSIEIISFEISSFNLPDEPGYNAYSIFIDYKPNKIGIFKTNTLILTTKDNTQLKYLFGDFVFDIDKKDSDLISTWESVAASSNNQNFPYTYSSNNNCKITKIMIGENYFIEDKNGLSFNAKIDLVNISEAPIKIIMSKIIVEHNGEDYISYGKGCYCGAVNAEESILMRSKKHWESFNPPS